MEKKEVKCDMGNVSAVINSLIAVGGQSGIIRVYDFLTYKLIWEPKYHEFDVINVVFSNNGQMLLSADIEGNVALWNVVQKSLYWSHSFESDYGNDLTFDTSSHQFVVAIEDTIYLYNSFEKPILSNRLSGYNYPMKVSILPTGDEIIVGDSSGVVYVERKSQSLRMKEIEISSYPIQKIIPIDLSNSWIFDGVSISKWDLHQGIKLTQIVDPSDVIGYLADVSISPSQKHICGGGVDGILVKIDNNTGDLQSRRVIENRLNITGVAFVNNGDTIAIADYTGELSIWDINSEKLIKLTQ